MEEEFSINVHDQVEEHKIDPRFNIDPRYDYNIPELNDQSTWENGFEKKEFHTPTKYEYRILRDRFL